MKKPIPPRHERRVAACRCGRWFYPWIARGRRGDQGRHYECPPCEAISRRTLADIALFLEGLPIAEVLATLAIGAPPGGELAPAPAMEAAAA